MPSSARQPPVFVPTVGETAVRTVDLLIVSISKAYKYCVSHLSRGLFYIENWLYSASSPAIGQAGSEDLARIGIEASRPGFAA